MRKVRIVIDIETNADEQEMDWMIEGLDDATLGIGHDSDGNKTQEKIVSMHWEEINAEA